MNQPANPWRRTCDELPAEGQIVEVKNRAESKIHRKYRMSRQWYFSLFGDYASKPEYWRPIEGEIDDD